MLHQFEEYVFPGGFLPWFNKEIFKSESDKLPFSPMAAVIINIVIGWPVYGVVGYLGLEQLWFSMPMMGILFVNAWFHIAVSIATARYSPGTFTSILFTLPLSLYTFYYYVMTWEIGFRQLFIAIAAGLIFHVLLLTLPRELIHAREKRIERQQTPGPADED